MQEAPVLRPLSVGDIIDRVLRLIRANIVLFIGIALIPDLLLEILQRVSGLSQTLDPNDLRVLFDPSSGPVSPRQFQAPNTGAVIAVGIVSIAVSLIQAGALIEAIGQRYRAASSRCGRRTSVACAPCRGSFSRRSSSVLCSSS